VLKKNNGDIAKMSARRSTGVMLIASGSIGIVIGLVLSASVVGALCGVPMIIVCGIMIIWGYLMKAKDQNIKDEQLTERMLMTQAVASGVNLCPKCRTPNHASVPICSGCGFELVRVGDPRPISAVEPTNTASDPVVAAFQGKRIKDAKDFVIPVEEDEHW
jgi:hypothetical protein